jgi:hypothetical protein
MRRVGDLLPEAARALGLEEELRLARAASAFAAALAERAPALAGSARLVRVSGDAVIVEVDHPLVGQEIHLRSTELLDALAAAPGGLRAEAIRTVATRG